MNRAQATRCQHPTPSTSMAIERVLVRDDDLHVQRCRRRTTSAVPGRFILLQEEEKRVFGTASIESSLTNGYAFKDLLRDKRWQDVVRRGATPASDPGPSPV